MNRKLKDEDMDILFRGILKLQTVSYTHLDVYKRQKWGIATCGFGKWTACGRLRRWPW